MGNENRADVETFSRPCVGSSFATAGCLMPEEIRKKSRCHSSAWLARNRAVGRSKICCKLVARGDSRPGSPGKKISVARFPLGVLGKRLPATANAFSGVIGVRYEH